MLGMTADMTFSMGLRTGNWGRHGIMLPFHKQLKVRLAPPEDRSALVGFGAGLSAVPRVLTRDEIHCVRVSDASGRAILVLDDGSGDVKSDRSEPVLSPGAWELRLEGARGVLVFYAHAEDPVPSDAVLDELTARFRAATPPE
jgi:hypothetical protein